LISIVCPTVDGREESLERCRISYLETTPNAEFIVVENAPTCNQAWNIGIPEARGEYIHLTADDIEATEGWWQFGVRWADEGFLPAARILNTDGSLQSCGNRDHEEDTGTLTELTRVPFFSRAQMVKAGIYPIKPEGQYFGDAYVSHRGRLHGMKTVVVREMCFYHHFAQPGRLDHMLYPDLDDFRHVQRMDGIRNPT
jgi:hypothetical protein